LLCPSPTMTWHLGRNRVFQAKNIIISTEQSIKSRFISVFLLNFFNPYNTVINP
jgi:hypothetical protein